MSSRDLFYQRLEQDTASGKLTPKVAHLLTVFMRDYEKAASPMSEAQWKVLNQFADKVAAQVADPYPFEPFHARLLEPCDYHQFGLEFWRPLVDLKESKVIGKDQIERIVAQLKAGENVIFFANHQTEPDPILINLLLEKDFPKLATQMIFVAGDRVVTDPLAVPMSLGCNLICIYSKKHLGNPPELRQAKQAHNQKAMKMMSRLLEEGGKCIYVAPSGGRDRPNGHDEPRPKGRGVYLGEVSTPPKFGSELPGPKEPGFGSLDQVPVAPFDPQSIEMFRLMAKQSGHPTHFYPMALATYKILPPPDTVEKELGEERRTRRAPIGMAICPEIDPIHYPGHELSDKQARRQALAHCFWSAVDRAYQLYLN